MFDDLAFLPLTVGEKETIAPEGLEELLITSIQFMCLETFVVYSHQAMYYQQDSDAVRLFVLHKLGICTKLHLQEGTGQVIYVRAGITHSLTWLAYNHPSLWTLNYALRKDCSLASFSLLQEELCQPPRKRVKQSTRKPQERLFEICAGQRDGRKNVVQALKAVRYCIRP